MVLFGATTIRLMIENYLKYGIRLNPKNWVLAVLTPDGEPGMTMSAVMISSRDQSLLLVSWSVHVGVAHCSLLVSTVI